MSNKTWDVEHLEALKQLAVKTILERFRVRETAFETVGAVSSDAAITMLHERAYFDARLLQSVARAEKATHRLVDNLAADITQAQKDHHVAEAKRAIEDLVFNVDADGTLAEQGAREPELALAGAECSAALAILRRLARSGNSTPTEIEEQEKAAALRTVVPSLESVVRVTDEEVTAMVDILRRMAKFA